MVKDRSDSQRGNPVKVTTWVLFSISSKGSFKDSSQRQDKTYHGLFYTSRGALTETRKTRSKNPNIIVIKNK